MPHRRGHICSTGGFGMFAGSGVPSVVGGLEEKGAGPFRGW